MQPQTTDESTTAVVEKKVPSQIPPNKAAIKEKKKKSAALKNFLKNQSNPTADISPKRNTITQEAINQQKQSQQLDCKICLNELPPKKKLCEFCKDIVCSQHIRKRRKHRQSQVFVRICDDCEDKYLYDKYMKLQTKAEQSLATQQLIIQAKHDELRQLVESKKIKIQVLLNKRKQIQEDRKMQQNRLLALENECNTKFKKIDLKMKQNQLLEAQIKMLQDGLPKPLEEDYNCLVEQNNKITKNLVKYEKQCSEALKATSAIQKQMYDLYYAWQKKQTTKPVKPKNQQCKIY